MKEQIQTSLEYLANLSLEEDTHQSYTDKDLENATLIFSHILIDVIFTTNKGFAFDKVCELSKTTGKAIRKLILASTGKDMHKIVKASNLNK